MGDAAEEEAENEYQRIKCDPAITVADLENALEAFFKIVGYRNMQEVLDVIKDAKQTWKSAAQAVFLKI